MLHCLLCIDFLSFGWKIFLNLLCEGLQLLKCNNPDKFDGQLINLKKFKNF